MKLKLEDYPNLRKSLYALAAAVAGVFIVFGVLNENEWAAILLVVEAALGLAFSNVPSGGDSPETITEPEAL